MDDTKEIEQNLVDLARAALAKNNLDEAHEFIMYILDGEYNTNKRKCTELWALKYYAQITTPQSQSEVEKLVIEYLRQSKEKWRIVNDEKPVSAFSPYQLGIIDEIFDEWKEATGHKGRNTTKLFIGWLKGLINQLTER